MFDDEELDQLREDDDEWKGHVDRQIVKKSRTSRKALVGSLTASFALVALLFVLLSSSILTSALIGLGGIGGFRAEITELNGESLAIYPAIGPTAGCPSDIDFDAGYNSSAPSDFQTLPQLRAEIGNANVPAGEELKLTKDIDLPNITSLNTFRVSVSQGDPSKTVAINDIAFYVTGLAASEITFENAQIREFFAQDPEDSFFSGVGTDATPTPVLDDTQPNASAQAGEFAIQNRPGTTANATIKDATARAHFLAFDSLTIESLRLETQYGNTTNTLPNVTKIDHSTACPAY